MIMNRRIRTFLGSLLILALLCAVPALAAETGDGTEKPQQTIETADSYTCVKGDKAFVLKALVTSGEPAARGALSFRSDRTDVASVDSNGCVTIKAVGTARIFVTAAETDAFRETTVEVTVKVNPKGTSIKSVKALASRMLFVKIKKELRGLRLRTPLCDEFEHEACHASETDRQELFQQGDLEPESGQKILFPGPHL